MHRNLFSWHLVEIYFMFLEWIIWHCVYWMLLETKNEPQQRSSENGQKRYTINNQIVSMLHQNEGGIGKSIRDAPEISWDPRDFPREILRAEGMDFPIPPEFWWSTDILSSLIFLYGVDQKILPCGQGRIDSVKINPSLLMMREGRWQWASMGHFVYLF